MRIHLERAAVALAFGLLVVAGLAQPPKNAPAPAPDTNLTALVLIDIQNFYFEGGTLPLVDPLPASLQAKRLLERFRTRGWPVVHVQHLPRTQSMPTPDAGDAQYQIHPNVRPAPGERVIGKHHANAFRDTDLLATLRQLGVKRLLIAGMQTHMCVEAATRAAADFGLAVIVAQDACATRKLQFQGVDVPAKEVQAAALAAMNGTYARVLSTDAVLSELP